MIKKLISAAILSSVIGSVSADPELGSMTMGSGESDLFSAVIAIDAAVAEISNQKLSVKLGTITDFYRHGVDYNQQVASLRFKVAKNKQGKPVIRVSSDRKIVGNKLKAVVKMTVGRKKVYGIYDIHLASNKSGHRVAFNLLNTPHNSQPQQLAQNTVKPIPETMPANDAQSVSSEDMAKKAALAELRKKLMAFEQAPEQSDSSRLATNQYQVSSGESISSIAMKLLPKYPGAEGWQTVMKRLVAMNADVFINGDINRLPAKAVLALPGQNDFAGTVVSRDKPAPQASKMVTAKTAGYQDNIPTPSARASTDSHEQYKVSKGENISSIAFKLSRTSLSGHKWRGIMKLLVIQNPDAFISGNINRIRSGTLLALPQKADFAQLYNVEQGESISSIAMKLQRQNPQPGGWRGIKSQLISMNPEAFINGNPRWLREDVFLLLPGGASEMVEAEMHELPRKQVHAKATPNPIPKAVSKPAPKPTVMAAVKPAQLTYKPAPEQKMVEQEPNSNANTYRVTEGESLSVIALKLKPKYPQFDNWYELMQTLARLNPTLLADNDIGSIRGGTVLKLPAKIDDQDQDSGLNTSSIQSTGDAIATPYDKISKSLVARADKASSFPVPEGYTISMVAIKLFPDYPGFDSWPELMDAIYRLNPDAFINNDINRLRVNAQLKLPDNIRS